MIWILIALIASLVVIALALPALRRTRHETASGMGAFAGQLEELRRDVELGLVEPAEAQAAERDIRRRAAAAGHRRAESDTESPRFRLGLIVASVLTAMTAVLIYMAIGSPHLAGTRPAPSAPAMPDDVQAVMAEIDALAADLMANPGNPRGWAVLGQAYLTLGRYDEAAIAFENAIDRVPDSAYLFSSLGQAYLFGENGSMTPRAREAFSRALDLEPGDVRARFFLAEADYQDGNEEAALAEWQALLEDAPEGAGYRSMIEARLAAAVEVGGD